MKLSDKITYHLSGIILYGALAIFVIFIARVIYVVRFQPCSAGGYKQNIISGINNSVISELNKYENEREELFSILFQKKLDIQDDFDLSPDSFIKQQKLFSNSLLFWSQNSNLDVSDSFTDQPKGVDNFYLKQLNQIQPQFVNATYEPFANNYYISLVNHFKDDKFYRKVLSQAISDGNYLFMFKAEHGRFTKLYFNKLFQINSSKNLNSLINVIDRNSVYTKLFATNELVCELQVNYPYNNDILIAFTPNASSHGNLRNIQVDYNLTIHAITQNNTDINIEEYSKKFIRSFQHHKFNNKN